MTDSTTRAEYLGRIADHAGELCDAKPHTEPRRGWSPSRHRVELAPHRTIVKGLIAQLQELARELAAQPDTGVKTVPASSPPGGFDAVALLASIDHGTIRRIRAAVDTGAFLAVDLAKRDTTESRVRAIVGIAARLPSWDLAEIADELGAWRRQAEVITTWRTTAVQLLAPCPVEGCGRRGTLLAIADTEAQGWCTGCGTRWGPDTIGILAAHVTDYRDRAAARSAAARAAAVASRRVGEWRHTPA